MHISILILTCIERNKRVRGGIQTFEYVREKCVLLFFLFSSSLVPIRNQPTLVGGYHTSIDYVLGSTPNFLISLSLVSCHNKILCSCDFPLFFSILVSRNQLTYSLCLGFDSSFSHFSLISVNGHVIAKVYVSVMFSSYSRIFIV